VPNNPADRMYEPIPTAKRECTDTFARTTLLRRDVPARICRKEKEKPQE
jgi:hypothetical protein